MIRDGAPAWAFRGEASADDGAAAGGLLGRASEVRSVTEALSMSRLVTLTGAPGIGKTRLARAVAEGYRDRSVVVELASVADPALVPAALLSALSVREVPGGSLTEALVTRLRYGRLLLVLDNCEHVLDSAARVTGELLKDCPALTMLSTSREPLAVAGERIWRVPPLLVPDDTEEIDPEALVQCYAAVRLFVERAAAVEPQFALNRYVSPAVVEICLRLDGIPLAIELAAARVEMLTPAEIAARLDDRFGLLVGGRGDLGRHQTLAAALDWSYELLSESEQALLRRLSVFVGGVDVEAAAAVCADHERGPREVADVLKRLVAKSLVVADPRADSPRRYHLLETIRAYAAERLEGAGEVGARREAHAGFYLALAERAEPELTGPGQQDWLRRLESERGNLRLALEWALGHGQGEWALRLAASLVLFWRVHCHFTEGRELLGAALAAAEGDAPPALLAKGLWGAGFLSHMAGGTEAAIPLLERSLAIATELGDAQAQARALLLLGNARQYQGDPAALTLLADSAALAQGANDSWCLAHALGCAGLEHSHRDEHPAARALLEECIDVARAAGDNQGLRFGLLGLGELAGRQGDLTLARSVFEETVAVADELGETYTKATALMYLGQVAIAEGEHGQAGPLLDRALALLRVAKPDELLASLTLRADVACVQGDTALAHRLLEEALPLARAGAPGAAAALQSMGELHVHEGDLRAARRLLEEALDHARSVANKRDTGRVLHSLGHLARSERDAKRAAVLLNEALELHRQIDNVPSILLSLEAIAGLAADAGRPEHAVRMLGAVNALREQYGHRRPPRSGRYEADLELARDGLPAREFESAFAAGAKLSLAEAMAEASNGRGEPGRSTGGWQTLTDTERRVAALVAEGMTNREIAELLFVSPSTVRNHLSHVFSKLGIQRRVQLAREVSRR